MKTKFLIIGGGTAGITVASRLKHKFKAQDITIVEPASEHYYQPMWTLVAADMASKQSTIKPMAKCIPSGVTWIKEFAQQFNPEANQVVLKNGDLIEYEFLIVAPGIQIDFDQIKGLTDTIGSNGVGCDYTLDGLDYVKSELKKVTSGNVIFTMPHMPIKCPGAPQKIMWLAHEEFTQRGVRDKINVWFISASAAMFGLDRYRIPLEKLVDEKNIKTKFGCELVAVNGDAKMATIRDNSNDKTIDMEYSFLHAVPPMSAPDFIKKSPLANEDGWVDVDKNTLQHNKYQNVFSLGDAAGTPNSKTGAAVRKQAPVVVKNIAKVIAKQKVDAFYNGYASCPLVVSKHQVIMAEFGYDGKIMESFPIDQSKPRFSMFLVKKFVLPVLYWYFMLKGRA